MQFLILGKDGKDKKALDRRMAVRESHLTLGNEMEKSGERWYGCALLDGSDRMIGSMAIMDFASEKTLQEWLNREPYINGKVWETVEIYKCSVKNPWKFNRPKSFFTKRKK